MKLNRARVPIILDMLIHIKKHKCFSWSKTQEEILEAFELEHNKLMGRNND